MKFCDLHVHSDCSDGMDTPEELVIKAKEAGLSALALTDHNTVKGLSRFLAAAKESGVEAIPGIEISTEHEGRELHLVGLFVEEAYYEKISKTLTPYLAKKEESNRSLCEKLNGFLAPKGLWIDYEALKRENETDTLNRAHFAYKLYEMGVISSTAEGFETLLSKDGGYYYEAEKIEFAEAVALLRSCKAVPILAHPFLDRSYEELKVFLPLAKSFGLVGMETDYTKFDEETTARAKVLADENGLLHSGGSDYHGARKKGVLLGKGYGSLAVPYDYLEKLKEAKETL